MIAIDPTDNQIIDAAAVPGGLFRGGVPGISYRTSDGGSTWERTLDVTDTVTSIVIDPQKREVVYAANGGYWVYKRTDGGSTWNVIKPPWWVPPNDPSGYRLAIDPHVPSHLYLGGFGYIADRMDGGQTWSQWGNPINRGSPMMEPNALLVDANNPTQKLYALFDGGVGLPA